MTESKPFGAERDPARLVAFSDGVVAISVTLLVLEIRPPHDTAHLWHGLAKLWPSYLAYAVTFLLIGRIWANHHVMFDHIRSADRVVLLLNTVLLMDLAFLPFAASVLAEAFRDGHGQRTAVVFHGIAFEVAAIRFNIIWWYARRHRRLLRDSVDAAGVSAIGRRFLLALAWIAAAIALGAVYPRPLGPAGRADRRAPVPAAPGRAAAGRGDPAPARGPAAASLTGAGGRRRSGACAVPANDGPRRAPGRWFLAERRVRAGRALIP